MTTAEKAVQSIRREVEMTRRGGSESGVVGVDGRRS